jgi:hypothetical protein
MNNVTYIDMLVDLWREKYKEIDMQFIEPVKYESDEEKVLRIIKGDFENIFGISLEKFNEVYHNILKNCPEKLI